MATKTLKVEPRVIKLLSPHVADPTKLGTGTDFPLGWYSLSPEMMQQLWQVGVDVRTARFPNHSLDEPIILPVSVVTDLVAEARFTMGATEWWFAGSMVTPPRLATVLRKHGFKHNRGGHWVRSNPHGSKIYKAIITRLNEWGYGEVEAGLFSKEIGPKYCAEVYLGWHQVRASIREY